MPRGKKSAYASTLAADALQSMQAVHRSLTAQRDALAGQISAIETAMRAFGAAPAASRGFAAAPAARTASGRAFRKGSLKEFITKVMASGATWRVKDLPKAILAAGFKTKNKTLAKSISIALSGMSNIRRVGRGQYRVK